jgi:4-amino-4-deoxy-L-arabinose transferase-like glycosyltransferase
VTSSRRRRLPWWLAVALLALGVRLAHLAAADPALRFSTSQHYFTGALEIVQHERPFDYVLRDDGWHLFNDVWTVAPLYPLFVAGVFALCGARLLAVQLVQALLEALTAVGFAALGRRLSPRHGAWAGVAYALWWPAIDFSAQTMTEGLHNALMSAAFVALARALQAPAERRLRSGAAGGALLGLAASARPVSLTFVPLAAVLVAWQARREGRLRALVTFAAVSLAGALPVAPWTARNVVFRGDFVVIESISAYTLWYDNAFVKPARFGLQDREILSQPTPAARRAKALELAAANLGAAWREVPGKAATALRHVLRPEGLHQALVLGEPAPLARRLAHVLGDDLWLLLTVALVPAALTASRERRAILLLALWVGYVLFMLTVVFHTEVRYRMGLMPPLFALAVAGWESMRDEDVTRRRRARLACGAGAGVAALLLAPFAPPLWRAARAEWRLAGVDALAARGDWAAVDARVRAAALVASDAAFPFERHGRLLARAGRDDEARDAYEQAAARQPTAWLASVALPQLLRQLGRDEEADARVAALGRAFTRPRAWEPLEAAWRELPAPRRDEIVVGRDDFGALRRFGERRRGMRWTQPGAALRLRPTTPAARYRVTLAAGSPEPSPFAEPELRVRCGGEAPVALRLGRALAEHVFECAPDADGAIVVHLDTPLWNRPGSPVDAGVQVTRARVTPSR